MNLTGQNIYYLSKYTYIQPHPTPSAAESDGTEDEPHVLRAPNHTDKNSTRSGSYIYIYTVLPVLSGLKYLMGIPVQLFQYKIIITSNILRQQN